MYSSIYGFKGTRIFSLTQIFVIQMLLSESKERLCGSYSQSFLIIFFIEGLSNFILSGLDKSSLPAICKG